MNLRTEPGRIDCAQAMLGFWPFAIGGLVAGAAIFGAGMVFMKLLGS